MLNRIHASSSPHLQNLASSCGPLLAYIFGPSFPAIVYAADTWERAARGASAIDSKEGHAPDAAEKLIDLIITVAKRHRFCRLENILDLNKVHSVLVLDIGSNL